MKLNSENLNINLRHLRALQAIAQARTFSTAAARLGIVPSALSELVRQLEESIGAPLFDRSTRPAAITPLGRQFLEETAPLLEGVDRAVTRLRQSAGLETGSLSIGASPSAISELIAPVLTSFLAAHPGIHCLLHDDLSERLAAMVADGALDMAIAGPAGADPDLHQRPILSDVIGLACRADHSFLRCDIAPELADLAGETVIGLARDTGTYRLLERSAVLPPALLKPRITAHSTIAQLCMIRAGMGVALLPQNAVQLFNDPQIHFLRLRDVQLVRTLYLLRPARRPLSAVADAFLATLEGCLPAPES